MFAPKFKTTKGIAFTAMLLSSLWLTACGGGGSSEESAVVNNGGGASTDTPSEEGIHGRVSLGPVYNAKVSLYKADDIDFSQKISDQSELLLDSATTSATDGTFSGLDAADYNGPVLLVVSVDAESSYYDEAGATGSGAVGTVSFSNVDLDNLLPANTFFPDSKSKHHLLFALLPEAEENQAVGITTLTTMATLLTSINHPTGIDTAQVLDYNSAVTKTFFNWLPDGISIAPAIFDASTASNSLDYSFDNDYSKDAMYALVLAMLADMGTGSHPALAAHRALLEDIKDTKINGFGGNYANFIDVFEKWQASLTDYTDSYATPDLKVKLVSNSYVLPHHQVLTCDGVANGAHDGICAKVDGQYRNALTSNYTGRFHLENSSRLDIKYVDITPASTNEWKLNIPVNVTGPVTTGCDSAHKIEVKGEPIQASFESLTDCQITYQRNGRVVSGSFSAKVSHTTSGEVYDVTEGHFRVTLPNSDDFITGNFDGNSLAPTPNDVFVHIYQPEKYVHLIAQSPDTNAGWEIVINNLGKAQGGATVTNTDCKPLNKGIYSYLSARSADGIANTNDDTNHNCKIEFTINNGVLEGTFEMTDVKVVTDIDASFNPVFHLGNASGSFKVYLPDGPSGYPSASLFN